MTIGTKEITIAIAVLMIVTSALTIYKQLKVS